ncbi:MAG TPA: hypothetical protein VEP90_15825 [Methylomirabilota bacterium]|nr:hypothetical protein [Methylomirabilota bacterium]
MTEINHNKRLSEVLSHGRCPRCNSIDKEAIAYVGDNFTQMHTLLVRMD